jgi:hypothetical protein
MDRIALDALERGWRLGMATGRVPHVQESEVDARLADQSVAREAEDLVAKSAPKAVQHARPGALAQVTDFIFTATRRYAAR